jgi:hypothetical protein
VGMPCDAWCSAVGLPDVSQAGLEPASGSKGALPFSQCVWYGEALYGLGIQGVEVLILLGALFLQTVAPASQQDF